MSSSNILFIYGSDDFLVDRRARALYKKLCPDATILQYDNKLDLTTYIKSIYENLNTISLFTNNNNIWIRGITFLGENISESYQASIKFLIETLQIAAKDSIIIISASPVDKRKKTFKEISQLSECQEVSNINENNIHDHITTLCHENNVSISPQAVELLYNLIGDDARLLKLEIDKLATYIFGDHNIITREDVATLVEPTCADEFFPQIEQFFSQDINKTFDMLERYIFFNHETRPLLIGLQNRIRLMIQIRALIDSQILPSKNSITAAKLSNIAQRFFCNATPKTSYNIFSQNPWYITNLLSTTNQYSLEHLLKLQMSIMHAISETSQRYNEQLTVIKQLAYKFQLPQPS